MRLETPGIILSVKRSGAGCVVRSLTPEHGKVSGFASPPTAKRPGAQPGYMMDVAWTARLPDQLGRLTSDIIFPYAVYIRSPDRLFTMTSALTLADAVSRERDPMPFLYAGLHALLKALADDSDKMALWRYPLWEARLLADAGYPLGVEYCAAGHSATPVYVSPASGLGVSREAGEPYKRKLLPLHAHFRTALLQDVAHEESLPALANAEAMASALNITGYFLNKRLFEGMLYTKAPQRAQAISFML